MFCGECGAQNPDTNQFCKNCGKPLARRQPAPMSAAQPVPPPAVPPAPAPATYQPPVMVAAPAPVPETAPKRRWNLLGILSVILGILSFGILTILLALAALLLGIIGFILFRKATGRIGISSIIGIVFGITAIIITIGLV